MKLFKALIVFSLIGFGFAMCDEPAYSPVPRINFNDIYYVDDDTDSLILYVDFRDCLAIRHFAWRDRSRKEPCKKAISLPHEILHYSRS
jgi:hypothetical protein